jgi:hypothetical protein
MPHAKTQLNSGTLQMFKISGLHGQGELLSDLIIAVSIQPICPEGEEHDDLDSIAAAPGVMTTVASTLLRSPLKTTVES